MARGSRFVAMSLLALLACASPGPDQPAPPSEFERAGQLQEHMRSGIAAGRSGQYEAALGSFREAEKLDPENLDVLYNLGTTLRHMGRFEEAVTYFERTVAGAGADPNRYKAYAQIGLIQLRLGDRPEAIRYFEKAYEANPRDKAALFHLARLHHEEGNDDASLRYIEAFRSSAAQDDPALLTDPERRNLRQALETLAIIETQIQRQE